MRGGKSTGGPGVVGGGVTAGGLGADDKLDPTPSGAAGVPLGSDGKGGLVDDDLETLCEASGGACRADIVGGEGIAAGPAALAGCGGAVWSVDKNAMISWRDVTRS